MSKIFSNTTRRCFSSSPKVVVIGGGIAGLTTAYRLQAAGINVELYEARNRVGGRIFTTKIANRIAELGGQNIADGGEAVHLNQLIKEFNLQKISSQLHLSDSYFNGMKLIPVHEILKNKHIDLKTLKSTLNKLASKHLNMKEILEEFVSREDPLYKILAVRLAAYEGGSLEKLSPLYIDTLFHTLLGGISSAHQGNKDAENYVDLVTIAGGNSLLPQKLEEALRPHLHLNMPVTKVSKTINNGFQLIFQNGAEVEAEILVLAIPCSVYEDITFEKDIIPSKKLKAIQDVHYGENAKIMVPFNAIPKTINTLISDDIVSFFDSTNQLLTIYYTGANSFFSPQTIASTYRLARPMMEQGFEHCPSLEAPTYAKDESNLSYEAAVGYSWPNDLYAKGSYSYIASGQEKLLKDTVKENGETFKALFAPIAESLYFAGEHTSLLFEVSGTMEAACESGERISRAIISSI